MPASESIDALRTTILDHRPRATVWGVGNPAHQQAASDHNPDDTPGVVSEQVDADNLREYRAIDVKIDAAFSSNDAHALVRDITTIEANRRRARYVIYLRTIYRRSTGYQPEPYTGTNPHITHVHVSSHVSDDANGTPWRLDNLGGVMSEADLNAYAAKYAPRDGNTSPTQRAVRKDWQTLNGTVGLATAVASLTTAVAELRTMTAAILAELRALPAAQLGDHHHDFASTGATTGPVIEE